MNGRAYQDDDDTTTIIQAEMNENRKECSVYVSNIPSGWIEEDLRRSFEKFGEISLITYKTDKPHNFAFIIFDKPESARKACLNYKEI